MKKHNIGNIRLRNCSFSEYMPEFKSGSLDMILVDPPYGYIDHKLDIPFDYKQFFIESYRILKEGGFIVVFGRGVE